MALKLKTNLLTLIKGACQAEFQPKIIFFQKADLMLVIGSVSVLFKYPGQVQYEEVKPMIDEATLQHFILGMMMALSYPTFKRFKYPYLALILIHPFVIEGVQLFMPHRTPDAADILVGLVGTLLGFCLV